MSKSKNSCRISRRNVLMGLGIGATTISALKPARAQLLPVGRRTEQHDVIVIGTGMAGTAASLQAKLDGADVMVLEKRSERQSGGNSRVAGGFFAVPSADAAEAKQQFLDDFIHKGQGRGNVEIYKVLMNRALDDVKWMLDNGAKLLPPVPQPPYHLNVYLASPSAYVGMPNVLNPLRQRFTSVGGKIAYETKAKQLILNNRGQVAGVRAIGQGGVVDYMGNAVVIAAGGYAGNKFLLEELVDPNADALMVRGFPWMTGDGLLMAQDAGAALDDMAGLTSIHVAAVNPKETSAGNPWQALPCCLGINRDGKRYIDESLGYVANGKATLKQPGQTVALIFDEDIKKLPTVASSITLFQNLHVPIIEADTIDELAGKINVPPAALTATVTAFNSAAQDGKAMNAVPSKAAFAYKVQTPKFYAFYPLVPGVALTFGGLVINTNAQVLEADGTVIPGLYAAGEGAGALYYDDYIAGASLINCLVMGRVAGHQAAVGRKKG